ncbi:DUF484 family protein [Jeongeupia chitinilytica]|uniref:DUF484 family protein n=1 Tax=Jeongeupia chitinilytica TaxID=1041641 RepID=A0ABQ3H596_9NEIS|nr:DUF484 family protein [Jeongeupia chitinilytica]GHD66881.1 hypothetical protein GCM10007350_29760 [Jeongeupia chitinilytica]
MQPHEIVAWLQANPAFFDDFADEIAQIYVPHHHHGQAVSLAERQLGTLRERTRKLESRMGALLQFGEENDVTSERLHRLTLALLRADSIGGALDALRAALAGEFGLHDVALRLWGLAPLETDARLPELAPAGDATQRLAEQLVSPYCGPHLGDELRAWFGERGTALASFGLFALRIDGAPVGVMVLASEDAERFYPDMGTLYLNRLAELVAATLSRLAPVLDDAVALPENA